MSEMPPDMIDKLVREIREMRVTKTTTTTVAAQPGWCIATRIYDRFNLDPNVAWEISRTAPIDPSPVCPGPWEVWREVTPIGFDSDNFGGGNDWCIKKPDGTFDIPGDCSCDNEAAALARVQQRVRTAAALLKQGHD